MLLQCWPCRRSHRALLILFISLVIVAVDSELSMRFPVIYGHLYKTKTPNDFFISGDSGAGEKRLRGL